MTAREQAEADFAAKNFDQFVPTPIAGGMRYSFKAGWDARDAEVAALTAQLQAAQAKLTTIRSIGARSGTDLNAWNKAFDVLDTADTSALAAAKAKALRDAADTWGSEIRNGGAGSWLRDRAASIEQEGAE